MLTDGRTGMTKLVAAFFAILRTPIFKYGACALRAGYQGLQTCAQNIEYCFSTAAVVTRTILHFTLHVHCQSCLELC